MELAELATDPQAFDTQLAGLHRDQADLLARIHATEEAAHRAAGDKRTYYGRRQVWCMRLADALAKAPALSEQRDTLIAQLSVVQAGIGDMDKVYDRAPWSRFFPSDTNSHPHIHATLGCRTLHRDTKMRWEPAMSGQTEAQAVADLDEALCSVCFPSAPVALHAYVSRRSQAEQAARAAEQAKRDAVKAAKNLTVDEQFTDGHDRKAHEAFDKAQRASTAAAVVGKADAYRELPPVIIRRIAKHESELRVTMHQINGTRPANDWRGAYGPDRKPATGEWLEQLTARKTFLEHHLEADRAALAAQEANGYIRLDRTTVHKGDVVTWVVIRPDSATVTRVNPKSVTLDRNGWPRTLPYEEIKSVECPHKDTTTAVTIPRRPSAARPKPEPVTIERPPEREAPVLVGASTEFFPTPADIVEQMIDAAELEAGMTVLEPSAGLGAIVSRVAPLVASVECIERDGELARRLRASGMVTGDVLCADFLGVPPAAVYDRVLMNPPFARQADVRHVMHALGFVKPGGMVVAIMSAGTEFRQDKTATEFRKLVADRGGRIERLPDDAFAASGISVRTVLAVIPVI